MYYVMTMIKKVTNFLYEVGTMRRLPRMHRQTLLTDDATDTIAAHSYRVTMIGWHLAKMEKLDPYKTVMMCLLHDVGEIRTGDQNWIHKKYIKAFDSEVIEDQLGTLPFSDLEDFAVEYNDKTTPEAIVAKDADLLDQLLLLREYEWQGNKEATIWLEGKAERGNAQIKMLNSDSAKELAQEILTQNPTQWWDQVWTNKNR